MIETRENMRAAILRLILALTPLACRDVSRERALTQSQNPSQLAGLILFIRCCELPNLSLQDKGAKHRQKQTPQRFGLALKKRSEQ